MLKIVEIVDQEKEGKEGKEERKEAQLVERTLTFTMVYGGRKKDREEKRGTAS